VKQKIIDKALLDYNTAVRFLIGKAYSGLPELKEKYKDKNGRYNVLALSKWVDSDLSRELNKFDVQPFKDSLKIEFGVMAGSCLKLGNKDLEAVFRGCLDMDKEVVTSTSASEQNSMHVKGFGKLRPIYFCRYDTKRSYCLLYNKQKDRFYAKIYLLNGANARRIPDNSWRRERLVHIHRDKSVLERTGRREAFIVVPLTFGKWQEKILKEAAE
jgi:putative transposase